MWLGLSRSVVGLLEEQACDLSLEEFVRQQGFIVIEEIKVKDHADDNRDKSKIYLITERIGLWHKYEQKLDQELRRKNKSHKFSGPPKSSKCSKTSNSNATRLERESVTERFVGLKRSEASRVKTLMQDERALSAHPTSEVLTRHLT